MEDHKSEIENWDLGAGIFITFYSLKSSLKEDDSMTELVSLQDKNDACKKFFSRLKGSLAFWEGRLPIDARTVYAKMAEEISDLLVAIPGEGSTTEVKLDCFNTIFDSPVPQDLLSSHLQSAISHFTLHLTEAAS
ncbi:putative nucleoporin peptidase S59 [Helianthus anomalus]